MLDRIGGYRTDFWPGEDTLLCKDIVESGQRIVYDPWVIVCHHRRPIFLPHLRQLGRYGFHRGYFCKRFPSNSRHFAYFVPSLFVGYLVGLALLAAVAVAGLLPAAASALCAAPLALYLVLVALASFSLRPWDWALVVAGIVASHAWYGVQFLRGLCAGRAPCEFIGKDHE